MHEKPSLIDMKAKLNPSICRFNQRSLHYYKMFHSNTNYNVNVFGLLLMNHFSAMCVFTLIKIYFVFMNFFIKHEKISLNSDKNFKKFHHKKVHLPFVIDNHLVKLSPLVFKLSIFHFLPHFLHERQMFFKICL